MPRRTEQPARQAVGKEMAVRIRLLIRNSQFLKDLLDLRKLDDPFAWIGTDGSPTLLQQVLQTVEASSAKELLEPLELQFPEINKPIHSYWEFLRKWDIEGIPLQLFIHTSEPLRGSDSVPGGEPLPQAAGDLEKIILQEPKPKYVVRQAVIASEPFMEWLYKKRAEEWFYKQVKEGDRTGPILIAPDDIPRAGTMLNIKIDLSYPQDVIEAEVKREVRKAKDRRQKLEKMGHLPRRPERLRLGSLDFQLKVYDLAKAGKTFKEIHGELHRSISTCKSALLAVGKKIASLAIPASSQSPVSKDSLPLVGFDSDDHISKCSECRVAARLEDMCELAKRFSEQDYVSQRERPGVDTVRDVKEADSTD